MFIALVAIGAYYGDLVFMIEIGLIFVLIIGFFFFLMGAYHISVIHHEHRDAGYKDPGDRIEMALTQAGINHTRVPRKNFLSFGERFLLPNDLSIVVHLSTSEDFPDSYDIYVGPVTEFNRTTVEKLKAFIDRTLE